MRRSLRWRVQAWYAAVLLVVVAGFAGFLYARVREARYREIDAKLVSAANYLDASLRAFPPHILDGTPRPEPDFRGGPPPPPPARNLGQLYENLKIPATGVDGEFYAIWRADGELFRSNAGRSELIIPDPHTTSHGPSSSAGGTQREYVMLGPRQTRILVGMSVEKEQAELRVFAWQLAGAGMIALAFGLIGGVWLSSRIVRPIRAISATAASISEADLSRRIDEDAVESEFAELARTLNATFARLEASFDRQTRFTGDASHELRTPLAIIRTHAELALSRPRNREEYQAALKACLSAASRMSTLVEGLLLLARADAGKLVAQRQPLDLSRLVAETITMLQPLAENNSVTLTAELAPITVTGDAVSLAQVATNLITNAIQYNRPDGTVNIVLKREDGRAELMVADTGCGIPAADQPHIFERFYRVDKARSRTKGGNGLGLAICKSIVDAHCGTIEFSSETGVGTRFRVTLPLPKDGRRSVSKN